MPDAIAKVNGEHAMAYQGADPWHQLGTKVEGNPTWQEMLIAAHLNWKVEVRDLFIEDDKEITGYRDVPIRKATVRIDTDPVTGRSAPIILGTVGNNYVPMQNEEAFAILDPAAQEFGVTIETAGALENGKRVWMLAKLPQPIEVAAGDLVDSYFLVATGHDGATPHTGRPTPIRVVCRNTIELAFRRNAPIFKIAHTKSAQERLDEVAGLIKSVIKVMTDQGETFRQMAQMCLTAAQSKAYVEKVLRIEDATSISGVLERRRDTIVQLSQTGRGAELSPDSLWNAYNAVTEYYDHVRPAEAVGARQRKANESTLFGANATVKAWALTVAEQILEAR
jgi:phage/plasmid-like protein (TIGR03299 family)